jgi:lipopolysaccharide/colanic/teichoic acid biosynthesis glycosyltransferase
MNGIFGPSRATATTPTTPTEAPPHTSRYRYRVTPARLWFDRILAAAGLAVVAPACALAAAAVWCEDGGPVLFRQKRVGLGGALFELLKFRSMYRNSSDVLVTAAGDRRVMRTGRWLRKFKLDELPQLWNVLRGEMSLVGPRPEVERYVDLERPEWRAVLAVRPGITDLATLVYRDEERILAEFADTEKAYREAVLPDKLALNLAYLERRTLWRDVKLLALTACSSLLPKALDAARIRRSIFSQDIR